jgi:alpha-D-xyloside xylohydrolase
MMTQAPLLPYSFFAANPPRLAHRQAGDAGLPSFVTRAAVMGLEAQGAVLAGTTREGTDLRITLEIIAPGVAHVLVQGEPDLRRVTLALPAAAIQVPVDVESSDAHLRLISDRICLDVELDPFHIAFSGPQGIFLEQDRGTTIVTDTLGVLPCGYSEVDGQRVAFHDSFVSEPDEHYYGFGEKFTDFDKRSQRLEMWNYDAYGVHHEQAYKNVPFYISTRGYGIFVDSVRRVNFDMGQSNHAAVQIVVPDSALDYYVIAGPDPKDIIRRYADLVSHPILPPKWSLGTWMSSGFKDDNADSVLERARELRARHIPCDVLHLDCYWQKYGLWSELLWDRAMFPDPDRLIREVHELGFHVCLWINSYIGTASERFTEGRAKGYFLKNPAGEPYVAQLWGNYHPPVAVVDVTNPEAARWYREMLRVLLRQGIDVFKTDFGEGVAADAVAYNGMTGDELHNLYTLIYNDLVAGVTAEETGRGGLVWGRSTYAGGQRHAAQWGGDPNCTYSALASTLRGGLSMAMCGHAFWSHDMGGFHVQPTPDLYIRWTQMGLFSPMSRWHGITTRLPWAYGPDAERITRNVTGLRYRLMPYIYTQAATAAVEGLPIIRPMVLEHPDDPLTYTLDLQYYFGPDILVAPIYNESGRRPVYLPKGQWIDFHSHELIDGPVVRKLTVPLDVLPLYVRANAIIPTMDPVDHLPDGPFPFVTFDAYLLPGGTGTCTLHDEDGDTEITAAWAGTQLTVWLTGAKRRAGLRLYLPGGTEISGVTLNGAPLAQDAGQGWSLAADGSLCATLTA